MTILAIETSCDETAAAVVRSDGDRHEVLSSAVASQIKVHKKFGGVVPMLAAREHEKNLPAVLKKTLFKLEKNPAKFIAGHVDLIAVTRGPGLIPALLTGVAFAKALAWKYQKPLIGINHLEGHIYSNFVQERYTLHVTRYIFPVLCLIVSGGHTELILVKSHQQYQLLGATLDDAAGEAFDKVARLLGLGYPGGPALERAAMIGNPVALQFPRPMIRSGDLNFSFAGLKTAVLYSLPKRFGTRTRNDIAASFQRAVVDVLVAKTASAASMYKVKAVMVAGGVAANNLLKREMERVVHEKLGHVPAVLFPADELTGDNAIMIAVAAYYRACHGSLTRFSWRNLKVDANAQLC